jgi:hypothetical protein
MKYLPYSLWILLLVVLGFVVGQTLIGWVLTAFIAFLIFPRFWDRRQEGGKRSFTGPRTTIAVLFTVAMSYAAWTKGGDRPLFGEQEAVAAVASQLRDPSNAEFRNVMEGTFATCGEVNGKNAFGGYVGFKSFVYEDGIVSFEPDQPLGADVRQQTSYYDDLAAFRRAQARCRS